MYAKQISHVSFLCHVQCLTKSMEAESCSLTRCSVKFTELQACVASWQSLQAAVAAGFCVTEEISCWQSINLFAVLREPLVSLPFRKELWASSCSEDCGQRREIGQRPASFHWPGDVIGHRPDSNQWWLGPWVKFRHRCEIQFISDNEQIHLWGPNTKKDEAHN